MLERALCGVWWILRSSTHLVLQPPTITESCRGMFQPLSRSVWERVRRKIRHWHLPQSPLIFHPVYKYSVTWPYPFDTDITRDSGCISYHCSTDKTTPLLLQQRLLVNPLAVHSSNVGSVLSKPSSSLTQVSLWLPQKISECHCTSWCSFVPMVPWWLTPCDSYHQSYHPRDV